jgi:hypothetical protein
MRLTARSLMLLGSANVAFLALAAQAQQLPGEQASTQAAVALKPIPLDEDGSSPEESRKADILFAPVPFSSPATGTGLAGGVVAFYNPNNGPRQWISGAGVVWTQRGSKGIAAFHDMSLNDDRIRVTALVSYFDAVTKFYGIGQEAGERGEVLELETKSPNLKLRAQMQIFPHAYAGVSYRFIDINAHPKELTGTPPPPADQLDSTMSMVGPMFTYDTRDSNTRPTRGVNISAAWLFGAPTWGDSFEHRKFNLSGSFYTPAGRDTVFAMNGALCAADGEVPYYSLCQFGSGGVLRGYASGRYRDRASWAVQGEVRHQFARRWGGVAFMGFGGIAPSLGDIIDETSVLPAAGVGVRYRPFKDNDVNLRVDFAIGKNDSALYLSIGEAF